MFETIKNQFLLPKKYNWNASRNSAVNVLKDHIHHIFLQTLQCRRYREETPYGPFTMVYAGIDAGLKYIVPFIQNKIF